MLPDTMIPCGALTKRSGHFTAVDRVSFAVARLNEPLSEYAHLRHDLL